MLPTVRLSLSARPRSASTFLDTRLAAGLALCLLAGCPPPAAVDDLASPDAARSQDGSAADGAPGTGEVGAPCQEDRQCATGQCLTEAQDPIYVGGYCTLKGCSDERAPCPSGSECRGMSAGVAICLKSCLGMMEVCRKDHRCCGPGPAPRWCAPVQSQVCMLR